MKTVNINYRSLILLLSGLAVIFFNGMSEGALTFPVALLLFIWDFIFKRKDSFKQCTLYVFLPCSFIHVLSVAILIGIEWRGLLYNFIAFFIFSTILFFIEKRRLM